MKPISTQIQKIIAIIPGVNILCLPIWLYNTHFFKSIPGIKWRSLWIIFSSGVPLTLAEVLISDLSKHVAIVIGYLTFLLIGWRLSKLQEAIENGMKQ